MNNGLLQIGPLTLDLMNNRLAGPAGDTAALPHKSVRVLALLSRNAGHLVTRNELIDRIWDGNYITGPNRLNDEIWKIRRELKAQHGHTVRIKTVPRKGYCLVVEAADAVTPAPDASPLHAVSQGLTLPRTAAMLAGLVTFMLLGTFALLDGAPSRAEHEPPPASVSAISANQQDLLDLILDLLDRSDNAANLEDELVVSRLLAEAEEKALAIESQPGLQARLLGGLSDIRYRQGDFSRATDLVERALLIVPETEPLRRIGLRISQARIYRAAGMNNLAMGIYRELLVDLASQSDYHPELAEVLNGLSVLAWRYGRYGSAEDHAAAALEVARASRRDARAQEAISLQRLGTLYLQLGRHEHALAAHESSYALRLELYGPTRRADVAGGLNDQAEVLLEMGRLDKARALAEQSLETFEQLYPPQSLGRGVASVTLARALLERGELEASFEHLTSGIEIIKRQNPGRSMFYLAKASVTLGDLEHRLGEPAKAE
ncbi:MAG: tetratricopeptide repeat protein, partial [Xanthomonadales bacterium]|nr:tetratricopeptide repeat protein [Xanthomonadales bacterium]